MPVFNEQKTIRASISAVLDIPTEKELIIVDDGSTDGTPDILAEYTGRENIYIVYHPQNIGKAGAIKTALPLTTGGIIAIQDADLEFNPNDLIELAQPIRDGRAAVVYGSRYLMKEKEKNIYPAFRWGVQAFIHNNQFAL